MSLTQEACPREQCMKPLRRAVWRFTEHVAELHRLIITPILYAHYFGLSSSLLDSQKTSHKDLFSFSTFLSLEATNIAPSHSTDPSPKDLFLVYYSPLLAQCLFQREQSRKLAFKDGIKDICRCASRAAVRQTKTLAGEHRCVRVTANGGGRPTAPLQPSHSWRNFETAVWHASQALHSGVLQSCTHV